MNDQIGLDWIMVIDTYSYGVVQIEAQSYIW